MITLNGHTLFPHPADWSLLPSWARNWKTGIGTSASGAEQRAGFRSLPLHDLSFKITPGSLQERCRLDARVDQATESGYACVPFFGKGVALAAPANAGANAITLADVVNAWPWAAGDYAALISRDDTIYDVLPVTAVVGSVLQFGAGVLTYAWPTGTVRPLLFGKFSTDKQSPASDWHTSIRITINQLVAERNAQLGNLVAPPPGIGQQRIGHTNRVG